MGQILKKSKSAAQYFPVTSEAQYEVCSNLLHKSAAVGWLSPAQHKYIHRVFAWQNLKPTLLIQHAFIKGHSACVKPIFKRLVPLRTRILPSPTLISAVSWHIWGWRAGKN